MIPALSSASCRARLRSRYGSSTPQSTWIGGNADDASHRAVIAEQSTGAVLHSCRLSSINGSRSAASIAAECAAAPTKRPGYLPASRNAANTPILSPMPARGDAGPPAGPAAPLPAGQHPPHHNHDSTARHEQGPVGEGG